MQFIHRQNSFDALRLIGAIFVLIGHGYILTGRANEVPRFAGVEIHNIGVSIFFAISGFLIWKSWSRSRGWQDYVVARALRILPALAIVIFLSVFVLGPLVTSITLSTYFSSGETYSYLTNVFMLDPKYTLPGVFDSVPYPVAVNGSLWTLRAEVACYVAVPVIALLPKKFRVMGLSALLILLMWFGLGTNVVVLESNLSAASTMWALFICGAIFAELQYLKHNKWVYPVIALAAWPLVTSLFPGIAPVASVLLIAFISIAGGSLPIPVFRDFGRFGDLSYGVYLVSFPVQQVIVQQCPRLEISINLLFVAGVSILLAWLLWWVVESPALDKRASVGMWLRAMTSKKV